MISKREEQKKNVITSLYTLLNFFQSSDCKDDIFDSVTKYGTLHASIDDTIADILSLLSDSISKSEIKEKIFEINKKIDCFDTVSYNKQCLKIFFESIQ